MSAHKIFTWVLQSMFITPTLIEATNNGREALLGCLKKLPLLYNSLNKEMVGRGAGERKFSHFVDLKNMISAHAKDFCEKKWPYLLYNNNNKKSCSLQLVYLVAI